MYVFSLLIDTALVIVPVFESFLSHQFGFASCCTIFRLRLNLEVEAACASKSNQLTIMNCLMSSLSSSMCLEMEENDGDSVKKSR
jgi:hypothetical protein